MANETFSYVIARPWDDNEPDNLCIYVYGDQIRAGSMKSARNLLEYVHRVSPGKQYNIYRVNFEKVE